MIRAFASGLALALCALAAGCGGGERSPQEVARAWSEALNAGDNEAAAELFAIGARIEQADFVLRVRTKEVAVAWNASLPCAGEIVEVEAEGDVATATFLLSDRKTSACDAPGAHATAEFTVRDGKIVLWRQTNGDEAPPADAV